ncbi:MAG: hypothetical protein JXB49_15155 [Bacteroidales bacterium]|nr:hypothetical protein [Bacteroidales bacterium]
MNKLLNSKEIKKTFNSKNMKTLFYLIASLLLIIWAFVYFGFEAHRTIHFLPVLACIIILVNTFYRRRSVTK